MKERSVTVELGERTYTISEAPYVRSKTWRGKLASVLQPRLRTALGLKDMTIEKPEDLIGLIEPLQWAALEAVDEMFDLLMAYDKALESDKEYIEQHATESQIVSAFGKLLEMADPFGLVRQLRSGLGTAARSMSLQGQSGDTPMPKSENLTPEENKI